MVVAPNEIMATAASLVEELDRERPQELTLRILAVNYAEPSEVGRQLGTLFDKRPEKRVKDTIEITSHERSSSLIILSSEENFEVIKAIVAQLDTEESVKMKTKTYELEYADAGDIADQMTELYSGMDDSSSRGYSPWYMPRRNNTEQTRFVPERRTNSIIAIAKPTE